VVNPFGYARQYVKDVGGSKRAAFFFPHRNETGYWWQGENSRLGSMATAALLGSRVAPVDQAAKLRSYARNQINWVLGMNPHDMCMLQGRGRNNPADYEVSGGAPSPMGGICNGFTSGVEDENDIAFQPEPYGGRGDWSWRWKEQWITQATWFVLALTAEAAVHDDQRG
ncbi:MAG: glycoside hydrolase family 9 protein, partial [bacterium]